MAKRRPLFHKPIARSKPERRTYKDRVYDSIVECRRAPQLDLDPDVIWWLRQVGFDLGEDVRYRTDFVVADLDGNIWAEEIKVHDSATFRKTVRLWRKYGLFPLHILWQSGNGWQREIIQGGAE